MNEKEVASGCEQVVKVNESVGSIAVVKHTSEPPKSFTFDRVFGPDSKQVDVYNDGARRIVNSILEGYNGRFKS